MPKLYSVWNVAETETLKKLVKADSYADLVSKGRCNLAGKSNFGN